MMNWLRVLACSLLFAAVGCASRQTITVHPREDPSVVLHNPGMGWVLYENYPLDQSRSSTMVALPNETFPQVDAVAIMFAWSDVEHTEGEFDFSKVDRAYDYWKARGKEIQLRMSAESLLWWSKFKPPSGLGVPKWVLDRLPPQAKQVRRQYGFDYTLVDARHPYYRKELRRFLDAVNRHFDDRTRPVTLIDLRGFALWGEWHTGYPYPTIQARHDALCGIIDMWCEAFPTHKLALSASYDPDSPTDLHSGPTDRFDRSFTKRYNEFLYWSAFDYALQIPQVTWRRDGAGGAVHSNERKLMDEAFARGRCPFVSEFVAGYKQAKKAGQDRVESMVNDALSLHPNYVNLLGWVGPEALSFIKEQPQLFDRALRTMGYRLVPTEVQYSRTLHPAQSGHVKMTWINRGVGRVCGEQTIELCLLDHDGTIVDRVASSKIPSHDWVKGKHYHLDLPMRWSNAPAGDYTLAIRLHDLATGRIVKLPLVTDCTDGCYTIGRIHIAE